jgi:hypothetical protein
VRSDRSSNLTLQELVKLKRAVNAQTKPIKE